MKRNKSAGIARFSVVAASLAAALIVVFAGLAEARAETASAWQESLYSRARLIAGEVSTATGPDVFAGVEIRLDEGWKTYWRNPGDAGIPPRFDWTGSTNLAAAEVLYPAPHRLPDPGGQSIGYKRVVVFPVRLTPADPGKPIEIRLKLDYAACANLCVPADAELTLTVPSESLSPADGIATALSRVPRKMKGDGDLPRIADLAVEGEGKLRRITVNVVQPAGADEADLFVEGPPDWYLPLPKPAGERKMGSTREIAYEIALDGLPATATLHGEKLRLTIVNAKDAVEQEWTLR
jgi:DsbC/DsbD-like thiol-disulfide interchange protein